MPLTLSLFLKASIAFVTLIYLIAINFRKNTKLTKSYKSNQKASFTAFTVSNEAISEEEALSYMPK